jgi:hypothetical protein
MPLNLKSTRTFMSSLGVMAREPPRTVMVHCG